MLATDEDGAQAHRVGTGNVGLHTVPHHPERRCPAKRCQHMAKRLGMGFLHPHLRRMEHLLHVRGQPKCLEETGELWHMVGQDDMPLAGRGQGTHARERIVKQVPTRWIEVDGAHVLCQAPRVVRPQSCPMAECPLEHWE